MGEMQRLKGQTLTLEAICAEVEAGSDHEDMVETRNKMHKSKLRGDMLCSVFEFEPVLSPLLREQCTAEGSGKHQAVTQM